MKHILVLITMIILSATSFAKDNLNIIAVEAKESNNFNSFIFYHDKSDKLTIKYSNGNISIRSENEIALKNISQDILSKLTKLVTLSKDKKEITLSTTKQYAEPIIVEGVNFLGIRFDLSKKPQKNANYDVVHKKSNLNNNVKKDIKVDFTNKAGMMEMIFYLDSDVGAASFIRGNNLWVIFDKKFNLVMPKNNLVPKYVILPNINETIIKFSLDKALNSSMDRLKNSWVLKMSSKTIKTTSLKLDKSEKTSEIIISTSDASRIIEFLDPDIGDNLSIITLKKPSIGISKINYYNNFTLIPSFQGVVIAWISDKHNINFNKDSVAISTLNLEEEDKTQITVTSAEENIKIKTSIPLFYDNELDLNFVSMQSEFRQKLVNADDLSLNPILMDFAEFYFVEKMYRESIPLLSLIDDKRSIFTENNYRYYLTKAISLIKSNQIENATSFLKEVNSRTIPDYVRKEVNLWLNYVEFLNGNDLIDSLQIIELMDDYISKYPDDLYWDLVFGELELAKNKPNVELTRELLKIIKDPSNADIRDKLHLYKAAYFAEIRDFKQAVAYYEGVKANEENRRNFAKAEFELIKLAYLNKEIHIKEAIGRLNNLAFIWRGDDLEMDILTEKAYLYFDDKDFINSLRTFKYLINSFPNNGSNFAITRRMINIYNKHTFSDAAFLDTLDDFSVVALFYEFRELTPVGAEGDQIIRHVARRLINLDLLDEAERLLAHQVRYRLRGEERVITGDHLAAIYLLNRKPANAIKTIIDTDSSNYSFREHLNRKRLKAKAYYDLQRYEDALAYVDDLDDAEALMVRRDINFKMSDWEEYIKITEAEIIPLLDVGKTLPEDLTSDVLRLAIAYSMLDKSKDLKTLNNILKTDNQALKHAVSFIDLKSEPLDIKNLDSQFDLNKIDDYFKKVIKEMFE